MTATLTARLIDSAGSARDAVALLGLRFIDQAVGQPVVGGLRATAAPTDQPGAAVAAVIGPSGVAGFHGLSGLADFEFPADAFAAPSPPQTRAFRVLIEDTLDRFLPAQFTVDLPLAPPPGQAPLLDVPVFSAPTRPIPPGFGAIRAQLRDAPDGVRPVPHAAVRVQVGDASGTGLADRTGRVLVLVPTPVVDRLRLGSPPGTGQRAFGPQTWPVTVRVHASVTAAGPGAPWPPPWNEMPTLKTLLTEQPQVPIVLTPGVSALEWAGILTDGEALALRTVPSSELHLERGGSPP